MRRLFTVSLSNFAVLLLALTALNPVLNSKAACPSEQLLQTEDHFIRGISQYYNLEEETQYLATTNIPSVKNLSEIDTRLSIGENTFLISGYTTPQRRVTLKLKDANDGLKVQAVSFPDNAGFFEVSLKSYDVTCFAEPILSGDILEVTPEGTNNFTINIEPLTLVIDKTADRLSGTAPPNCTLRIKVERPADPGIKSELEVQVDARGNYNTEISGLLNIRGGDLVTVKYTSPAGHEIYISQYAGPLLRLLREVSALEGYIAPGSQLDIVIKDSTGAIKGIGVSYKGHPAEPIVTGYNGYFIAGFVPIDSSLAQYSVFPTIGDTIEVIPEGQATLVFPVKPHTMKVDKAGNKVTGTGTPGYEVRAKLSTPDGYFYQQGTIDNEGNYILSFAGISDIKGADYIYITIVYPDDNEIILSQKVEPYLYLQLNLNSNHVEVYTLNTGVPRNLTLKDAQGIIKATSSTGDFLNNAGSPIPIVPGDTVEVTAGEYTTRLVVPPLSMIVDRQRDTVSGTGSPSIPIILGISRRSDFKYGYYDTYRTYKRTVIPDELGQFIADFRAEVDIRRGDSIGLKYVDNERNVVFLSQTIPVLYISKDSNYVHGITYPGTTANITLRGTEGIIKAQESEQYYGTSVYDFDLYFFQEDHSILVRGGDTVEVSAENSETMTVFVEPITITVDKFKDIVSGTGPPDSKMLLSILVPGYCTLKHEHPVATDADGKFAVDVSSITDLKGGEYLLLSYLTPDEHTISLSHHVPIIQVHERDNMIIAYLDDTEIRGRPVTFTLLGPDSAVKANRTVLQWGSTSTITMPTQILGGDTLHIKAEGKTPLSIYIPPLTAGLNLQEDTIKGTGPPNSLLTVYYLFYHEAIKKFEITANVTTDGNGNYSLDLHGITDISIGGGGWVRYDTSEGNQIYANYSLPLITINYNSPLIIGSFRPSQITINLRSPSGKVKASGRGTSLQDVEWPWRLSIPLLNQAGNLAPVQGGDTLEVTSQFNDSFNIFVQTLDIEVDKDNDILTINGPANFSFHLVSDCSKGPTYRVIKDVTTDDSGTYILNLKGVSDIENGDSISLSYTSPEGSHIVLERGVGMGEVAGMVYLQGYTGQVDAFIAFDHSSSWMTEYSGYYSKKLSQGNHSAAVVKRGYLDAIRPDIQVADGRLTILPTLTLLIGDLDSNDKVDIADLSALAVNLGTSSSGSTDINCDGVTDIFDLALVAMNFGKTSSPW